MKSPKLIIFLYFLIPVMVSAQKGYEPGFVVTNNKDTVKGLVKDRKPPPFGKLYDKIYFKNSQIKRKYRPEEILAYQQGNRVFESFHLDISSNLLDESYFINPSVKKKQFLKVDLKGYLTLYQMEITDPDSDYVDQIPLFKRANENYFQRVTQGMFGLKKKKLTIYFNDCPKIIKKIEQNELKTPMEIARFYNKCKNVDLEN